MDECIHFDSEDNIHHEIYITSQRWNTGVNIPELVQDRWIQQKCEDIFILDVTYDT